MKTPVKLFCLLFPAFLCFKGKAQSLPVITFSESINPVSIRGISIPGAGCIWVSGSNGTIGHSSDSGFTYNFIQLNDYKNLDFRDIHAINDSVILILNAGSPAHILKTEDAGKSWKEVYRNMDKKIFFDGFDFWDKQHGIAFSDPLESSFFILTTHDGGETWQVPDSLSIPECFEEEAGFAASGTSIRCGKGGRVAIGTGGSHARLFLSDDFGITWNVTETPLKSGKASTGIFSLALTDENRIYIAGGDYKADSLGESNFFFTDNDGFDWHQPEETPSGFSSCIQILSDSLMISTGTRGTDLSVDQGISWKRVDDNAFHVAGSCLDCPFIILGGPKGRLGILQK